MVSSAEIRNVFVDLAAGGYLRHHHNVIITGATGLGKTYLGCAFRPSACPSGK
ncbi:MAG: ATP-binding protein [Actinobacteria bacterium]|nr:ATP-binding protein [Actinomycetota bacterium]